MWLISVTNDAGEGGTTECQVLHTCQGTFEHHNNLMRWLRKLAPFPLQRQENQETGSQKMLPVMNRCLDSSSFACCTKPLFFRPTYFQKESKNQNSTTCSCISHLILINENKVMGLQFTFNSLFFFFFPENVCFMLVDTLFLRWSFRSYFSAPFLFSLCIFQHIPQIKLI